MYRRYPHMYKGHIPINREHIYTCTESTHTGAHANVHACVYTHQYKCIHAVTMLTHVYI